MKIPLLITFFSLAMMYMPLCDAETLQRKDIFHVAISMDTDSLKTDFYKKTGMFFVNTTVKNTSSENQEIVVWTQYGWSWKSDNPHVGAGQEAAKNGPTTIVLKPGQKYSSRVEMFYDKQGTVPLMFRLGFFPKPEPGHTAMEQSAGLYWSQPIILNE